MTTIQSARAAFKLIGLIGLGLTNPAHASQQGSLGATSTGSITITVSTPVRARISGLEDVHFGNERAATTGASENVCLWSNSPAGLYTIVAHGSGSSGSFELSNGKVAVGYTVAWSPRGNVASDQNLRSGSTVTDLQAAVERSECGVGRGAASLAIAMNSFDLQAARQAGPYVGSLTLIVSPE